LGRSRLGKQTIFLFWPHMSLQEQWKITCGHMCKWLKLTLWFLRWEMLQMDQGAGTCGAKIKI
jgi:hypothetical protein